MNDDASMPQQATFYNYQEQNAGYEVGYTPYPAMQHPGTRGQIVPDMHASYQHLNPLAAMNYQSGVFAASPPHGSLPLATSPPPPSPEMYEAVSPPLSGSDTSGDGLYHHSNSSGANSPSSSRGHSLVHRHQRFNPTPSPTSSSGRRRSRSHDSDDEDDPSMGMPADNLAFSRKEATRRQRIEAEQRRRDELREGYAKLKDALPVSNQKSSKVSLLERATMYIIQLEKEKKELMEKLQSIENEAERLRAINEKISLSAEGTPSPVPERRLTPVPHNHNAPNPHAPIPHSLASVLGQQPPSEHSSPSASEGGH